jgi:hypothetical protein
MRILTTLAVTAALLGAQPAQAAPTSADFQLVLQVNCFGCGQSAASGTFTCLGVCLLDGVVRCAGSCTFGVGATVDIPSAVCPLAVQVAGNVAVPGDPLGIQVTSYAGAFLLTGRFFSGATANASGGAAVTAPVGVPCGGPATFTLSGHLAGS